MDILSYDLQLQTEASARKKSTQGRDDDESDPAFHFIAFMPAMGQLWKFDGLERQPRTLGMFLDYPIENDTNPDRSMHRRQLA